MCVCVCVCIQIGNEKENNVIISRVIRSHINPMYIVTPRYTYIY